MLIWDERSEWVNNHNNKQLLTENIETEIQLAELCHLADLPFDNKNDSWWH